MPRASRFKAKPVVDVAIYRGEDALWGSAFALLTDGLGLGVAAMAGLGAVIAEIWAATGAALGAEFERKAILPANAPLRRRFWRSDID